MDADEVIARLADQARGTISDFVEIKDGMPKDFFVDLEKAQRLGKMHLVKKLKYNSSGKPEIELHDQQNALIQIGRLHGLFTDRQIVDDTGLDDNDRAERIASILDTARARRDGQSNNDNDD